MKKVLSVSVMCIAYVMAASCLVVYGFFSLSVDRLTPEARLFLLCGCSVFMYLGSLVFAKKIRPAESRPIMDITFWAIFGVYVVLLLTFTLFDGYFGRGSHTLIFFAPEEMTGLYTSTSINLIPFKNIFDFVEKFFRGLLSERFFFTNILGNIAAFMPFAFFLPLLTKRFSRFVPFALFTGGCIIFVEITQIMLLTGFCDIDDLILNLGGACLAYLILHIPFVRKGISAITMLEY